MIKPMQIPESSLTHSICKAATFIFKIM